MKKNTIINATIGLMFLTFISKVLGFVREMVISYIYGASAMSDAYSMANSVAVLIVTGLASGIMTAYIPSSMEISDSKKRDAFTSNVINTLVTGAGIAMVVCLIFTNQIVDVLGQGFAGSTKHYMVILLRFVIVSSVCIFLIYMISGYLNVKQNFSYGGVQLVITNIIIIAAVVISKKNPWGLGAGYLIAYIIPMFLGFYYLKRYQLGYSRKIDFTDSRLRKMYAVSMIAFWGTNVIKFDVMIDRVFASSLQEGTVAAVNYAFTLISIFPEVVIMTIATVGYPKLAEWFAKEREKEAGKYINSMIVSTSIILMPVMVIFLEMGKWVIQILFQHGAFNASDTILTMDILNGYSYGLLGIGVSFILCKIFFARKEEWVPAVCLGGGIAINTLLDIVFGHMGAYQLALTTSISVLASTLLMILILIKKCPEVKGRELAAAEIKILAAALAIKWIAAKGMSFCAPMENSGVIVKILILGGVSLFVLLIFILLLYIFRVEEIKVMYEGIRRKIKGRR